MQTFIAVAHTKNYTKAANLMNITQPAVSQHIKFLEEYYQVTLFYQKNRQMKLSEEGEILLQYATETDRLSKIVKARLANKAGISKKYHLGATLTIGGYVLPEIIGAYKKEHENLDVMLQVENTEAIIKKLYAGDIDLGVIEGLFNKKRVCYIKLKDDELVLAVSVNHPFADRESVGIDEVLSDRLILREKGSGTRMVFEDYLQQAGCRLDEQSIYMEIGDITAIVSLVESNLGCTVISKEVLKWPVGHKTIRIVPIINFQMLREFNFIFLANDDDRFRQDFIAFCQQQVLHPLGSCAPV
jgi:DNA-binding transcriptional LysR family regulator